MTGTELPKSTPAEYAAAFSFEQHVAIISAMSHDEKLHLLHQAITSPNRSLKIMSFKAHFDDGGYGAGGYFAWMNMFNNQHIPYYLTQSNNGSGSTWQRQREISRYLKIIGNPNEINIFKVSDGYLMNSLEPIFYELKKILAEEKPDLVIYLSPDTSGIPKNQSKHQAKNYAHIDHEAIGIMFEEGVNGEDGLLRQFSLPGIAILSPKVEVHLSPHLQSLKYHYALAFTSQLQHLDDNIHPHDPSYFNLQFMADLNGRNLTNIQGARSWVNITNDIGIDTSPNEFFYIENGQVYLNSPVEANMLQ